MDTHNVTDMTCMFYEQGAQTQLDISNLDLSNCTSFNHMFCDNFKLQLLDLSKWNIKIVNSKKPSIQLFFTIHLLPIFYKKNFFHKKLSKETSC